MKKEKNKIESLMLKKGYSGEHFFSDKNTNSLTALAIYYKRKIKTQRIVAIIGNGKKPIAFTLTKVTIHE